LRCTTVTSAYGFAGRGGATRARPSWPTRRKIGYPCLRDLGIRQPGPYAPKDTYISTALTAGVNTSWLEAQTGVRYETMRRHDGKWLRTEGADQLRKIEELAPELAPGVECVAT
jgi:hypothetical protein